MIKIRPTDKKAIARLKKLNKAERDVIYHILGDLEINGDPHELILNRATFNRLIRCFRHINCSPAKQGLEITTFVDANDAEFMIEEEDERIIKEIESKGKECEHEWGTDGQHSNVFCKKCYMSEEEYEEKTGNIVEIN
jgi:hypothetical protein